MTAIVEKLNALLDSVGLTKYEAQAFRALFSIKEGTMEEISAKSKVPLSKTYEIMNNLERRGFVSAIMSRPKKYKIIPPEVAFLDFLKDKDRELMACRHYVEDISQLFHKVDDVSVENIQLFRTRDVVLNFLANYLKSEVKHSYNACVAFRSPRTPLSELLKDKIKGGLDVKFVGCVPDGKDYVAKKYKRLGVKVRTLNESIPPMRFSIYDNKQASFTLSDAYNEYVTIWTSSRPIVKTIAELFKHYWDKGSDF